MCRGSRARDSRCAAFASRCETARSATPVLPKRVPILHRMKDLQAFPPSAAASLVSGYCADFIELAASMAQTLEQVTMRGLDIGQSGEELARVERGMRALADAIHDTLAKVNAGAAPRQPSAPVAQRPQQPIATKPPAVVAAQKPVATASTSPRVAATKPANEPTATATATKPAAAYRVQVPSSATTLQGNTETLPMRSVFQFLSRTRKNGMLHVTLEQEKVRFQFVDGCLVGTSSTQAPANEGLGNILAELGVVEGEEIAPIVKQHGDGRQRLGSILVQMGRITHEQLAQAVELQTSRRFQRIVACKQATYEFHAESDHGEGGMRIRAAAGQQQKA